MTQTTWERGRKIRVLHLIKSLSRGGAERLLVEGLRCTDRDRFDLSYGYFHPKLDALAPALAASGAEVTCFGGENHVGMLARVRAVAQYLRAHEIDVMHCHLPIAGVVGRLAGRLADVPVVYTEHNKCEWYRRPTFMLNAWSYGMQARVIAVSGSVNDSIQRHIRPRIPVTVVRNGIDSCLFRRSEWSGAALRAQLGIARDALVIGNVAALIPQKRLLDWIAAARMIRNECPNAHFLLIGDGPMQGEVERSIAEHALADAVHLCGAQPDVRPYLAAMDINMMSSAFEGLPVALLEAMAMECVPVCTAVGGIVEVVCNGENGCLVEAGRPDELARVVVALARDRARMNAIATAARRHVEREFRLDRMVRDIEAVYVELLGWSPSAAPKKLQHVAMSP